MLLMSRTRSTISPTPWPGHTPEHTTLHHFALEIAREDYDKALGRLAELGVATDTAVHPWVGWRSIYFRDPEDNTVELVCFDESVRTK
jgi:catechol-2,3-dioxygenase